MIAIGLEGSANKIGIGVISHPAPNKPPVILSNLRHTYISPPGEGFLPKDTALHHRAWVVRLIKQAVQQAGVKVEDIDCICYTKGPGMGAPLQERCARSTNYQSALEQAYGRSESLRRTSVGPK